jgi:hypothetical protein
VNAHPVRFARQCRGDDRRIWRETAESMEVAFGYPHSLKPMLVGVLCSFEQQFILVSAELCLVVTEIRQTEFWPGYRGTR